MGRRKIDISMVDDPNNRQVTFSKRRSGLFKKANELSILCNAEMAVVMFSPGDKPYSFGHPDVNVVADKFLQQPDASNVVEPNHEPENNPSYEVGDTEILTRQLSLVQVHIGEEHKKASELDKREKDQEAMEDLEVSPAFQRMVEDYVDAMEVSEYMLLLAKEPVVGVTNQAITNKRRKN